MPEYGHDTGERTKAQRRTRGKTLKARALGSGSMGVVRGASHNGMTRNPRLPDRSKSLASARQGDPGSAGRSGEKTVTGSAASASGNEGEAA